MQKLMQAKQPLKHAELIKAWADGAEIQFRDCFDNWNNYKEGDGPQWLDDIEYRIKPEEKPDVVKYYKVKTGVTVNQMEQNPDSNLKLTFDGETGKLKSAEVIETE